MRLENWYKTLEKPNSLFGDVFGHPTRPDGTHVTTSDMLFSRNGRIFTLNSVYELGEPAESYEAQFPDSKNRLLKILAK